MTIAAASHLAWYAARSAGVVAWALASASIVWGLALSTRIVRRRGLPAWLLDLHRFLGTLTLVAVGVHLIGLWADTYVTFGWRELFVPMGSSWRPVAVLWGVVSLYLLVAIQATSWMMRRLPRRLWHAVHLTSFGVFLGATVHGYQAGTDAGNLFVQWTVLTGSTLVLFLTLFRVLADGRQAAAERRRAGVDRREVVADAVA